MEAELATLKLSNIELKMLTNFGKEVEKRRKELNWSLRRLADESGVSHISIMRVERHEMEPGLMAAYRIAKAVGIDLGDL